MMAKNGPFAVLGEKNPWQENSFISFLFILFMYF